MPLDMLLDLDGALVRGGFPPGFRYHQLFCAPEALGVVRDVDLLFGVIPPKVVAAAVAHADAAGPPTSPDYWEQRTLDE